MAAGALRALEVRIRVCVPPRHERRRPGQVVRHEGGDDERFVFSRVPFRRRCDRPRRTRWRAPQAAVRLRIGNWRRPACTPRSGRSDRASDAAVYAFNASAGRPAASFATPRNRWDLRFRRKGDGRVELASCVVEPSAGEVEHPHRPMHLERGGRRTRWDRSSECWIHTPARSGPTRPVRAPCDRGWPASRRASSPYVPGSASVNPARASMNASCCAMAGDGRRSRMTPTARRHDRGNRHAGHRRSITKRRIALRLKKSNFNDSVSSEESTCKTRRMCVDTEHTNV